ncbi:MAG TPA: peptidoglycan recognition protein [Nocardioides sp.]|nr:peptidoglycan recognition protein [Nocardioides sp.]
MSPRPTTRRPVLVALAGGAAAVAGVSAAARSGILSDSNDESSHGDGVLRLSAGGMGVESLDVPLTDAVLTPVGPRRWQSSQLPTSTHTMVGFTWRRGEAEPRIEVSSRARGRWQPWLRMPHLHDAPDADSDESTSAVGTDVVWIGPADGIRLRVLGHRPADLTMVLLHPTALPSDPSADDGTMRARSSTTSTPDGTVPPPALLSRRDWGAERSWRTGRPEYVDTIKQVHVHHTANSNTYARADVPALIRGMYAYHTQSLGWSDIAYNFLVDRFGRVWVGRSGGPAKPVRGAHTLGFNATSTGIAAIGNFDVAEPGRAVLGAIARIAAWKLHPYGRNPRGRIAVTSEGSDKFRRGRRVTLPVIDGHRDTNDTACPGRHLYDRLPTIRRRAQARIDRYTVVPKVEITAPFVGSGAPVDGAVLAVTGGAWTPPEASRTYTWLRDGEPIWSGRAARRTLTTADVGSTISVRVDLRAEDHEPASQLVTFSEPVKALTRLSVAAVGRRGRAVVRATIETPGIDTPFTGPVTVRMAGEVRRATATDGRVRVAFDRLEPGHRRAHVYVPATSTATAARASDSATVKPRR